MDNIYLKFPTIDERNEWISYIIEFRKDNSNATPLGCTENLDYDNWLVKINNEAKGINLKLVRIPSTVYFLMKDKKI